jgi:hypothetical protein
MTEYRTVAVEPHSVRQVARARAVAGLARAHPGLYRELYQQALDQARETLAARPAHQQASRQARVELKARLPEEYAAHYQAELTLIQPVEPPAAGVVDRHGAAVARLRALLWLADQYPDLARQRLKAEEARLPLDPGDRAPGRCRALAWVRALDGLRSVFPKQFQTRYLIELAGQVDQGRRHDPGAGPQPRAGPGAAPGRRDWLGAAAHPPSQRGAQQAALAGRRGFTALSPRAWTATRPGGSAR